MNYSLNKLGAANAAAIAAMAASSAPPIATQRQISDSIEMENFEGGWQYEDGAFLDLDGQRNFRTSDDVTDYPHYGWVDITKKFFGACSELKLGELAQDMLFGLFEAMSAIEMMDPKMDVGMGFNKTDTKPHTFETAVAANVLKIENLTPEELIGIFDSLLSCIVAWLEGNSMDQVLFTCLYLHSPSNIKDKSLRAFCIAVVHLINIIKNIIFMGSVFEEEDFQLFGASTLLASNDCVPASVSALVKEAEDDILHQYKSNPVPETTMAVLHRLRFMRHFFQTMNTFECGMVVAPDETVINEIHKNINAFMELVPMVKRTIEKGTQSAPGSDAPNPMGFSPRIHDRSQPPTFPRSVKIRDRPTSLQFLEELVQRLKHTCKIVKMRNYYLALNFFIDFSRKSGDCILSRSVLQGLFISNRRHVFGFIQMKDFLLNSVRAFSNPPVLNPKFSVTSDRKIQGFVETFFRYAVSLNTFTQFIRICGFNRARQRDKLARFIESFDSIQVEAARLDSQLNLLATEASVEGNESCSFAYKNSAHFATWVLYNCFRAMLLFIMSGFDLELYSVHEYIYIYWYPYELLISFIVSALTRTENQLATQEDFADQMNRAQNAGTAKSRKSKVKKKKNQGKPYRQEIVYYHALLNMCGGLYKAMGALTKDGRIKQPMPKFDNEQIRFNRRFSPFATLTSPPPVSYLEFKSIQEHMMKPPSSEIYSIAARHFEQAKNVLETIQNPEQEILDLLQVAKINFVVMNVLAKGHQKDNKTQPDFDFSKHRHFPIIKIN